MASYQDGVPIEKNDVKGGVPVEEKENNVNNINREVFQYIISRGSIMGGIIYHIIQGVSIIANLLRCKLNIQFFVLS